jgi:hypothetical protein
MTTGKMFWLGVGAAVGLAIALRLRAAAGDQGMLAAAGSFWSDVRDGMQERESELRTSLGLADDDTADSDDSKTERR